MPSEPKKDKILPFIVEISSIKFLQVESLTYICTVFSTEQPPNIVKSGEIS